MRSWKHTVLGSHIDLLSGFAFSSGLYSSDDSDVKLLRGDNVIQGQLRWDGVKRWSRSNVDGVSRYLLRQGDIVLAMDRTWVNAGLKCALVNAEDVPCLLVQRVARIRGSGDLDTRFLYQMLRTHRFTQYVKGVQTETAIPHISSQQIREFPIHLPPLPEQQKIAAILSTWDRAIELTEKLIAAKQKRKQALMQQLLTGKVRFKEFVKSQEKFSTRYGNYPKDWQYVRIERIAKEVSERNIDRTNHQVLSCTKYDGLVDSLSYFGKQIFSDDLSTYKVVRRNHFAYATNHIEEGSIGYQNVCDIAVISPMYTVFKTRQGVDNSFLYKLLKSDLYVHIYRVNTSASVDRRGSLRWEAFSHIRVSLPTLEEQQAIAVVLDRQQREINVLGKKCDALKQQKKGLMQQLLTGNIRVLCSTRNVLQ